MSNEAPSKLDKWREKYAALVVALACLYGVIDSWSSNWILTGILSLGLLICGTIGVFDIKRAIYNRKK